KKSTEEHVAACESCAAVIAKLEAVHKAFAASHPVHQLTAKLAERQRRRSKRWLGFGALGMLSLAAASFLLPVFWPRGGVRLKGGGLALHRKRGDVVRVLSADDRVRAGDALRIVVTLSVPNSVGAWMVDAHGRVDRLVSQGLVTLPAGEQALEGSAVVE